MGGGVERHLQRSEGHADRAEAGGCRAGRDARYDRNGNLIIEEDEKYLFYTYNHYNDFQEYLNYEGGWGEMFGNITGGGEMSSKVNYNPTPYVEVVRKALRTTTESAAGDVYIIELAYIYYNTKFYANDLCA